MKIKNGLKVMALQLWDTENQELYGEEWKKICAHLANLGKLIEDLGFSEKISYTTLKY